MLYKRYTLSRGHCKSNCITKIGTGNSHNRRTFRDAYSDITVARSKCLACGRVSIHIKLSLNKISISAGIVTPKLLKRFHVHSVS